MVRGAMARKPRIEYPGALYHVIARGNQRRDVYHDDMDRLRYLAKLRAYKQRYAFRLYAYVLMTNHVHLLLEPQQIGLSKIMQGLHQSYTQGYNRRYGAVGHVFQGRYQAILCDRDSYLLALVRYIHLNPVRARLVRDPADYPWSGHRAYLDSAGEGLVDTETVLGMLGQRRSLAQRRYQGFVAEELASGSRPEYYQVREQQLLGDDAFVEQVQRTAVDTRPQPVKAPSLAALLSLVVRATGVAPERIAGPDRRVDATRARRLLVQAGAVCAVPGRDLARLLGRDPAVISRLARMSETERAAATRVVAGKSTSQV
jgi:REP element-mobilizing transposase RayT